MSARPEAASRIAPVRQRGTTLERIGNSLTEGFHIGALFVILAVMMTGIAAKKLFVDAARSRRPRWQRAYGILLVLFAGYLVVLAFRGV